MNSYVIEVKELVSSLVKVEAESEAEAKIAIMQNKGEYVSSVNDELVDDYVDYDSHSCFVNISDWVVVGVDKVDDVESV